MTYATPDATPDELASLRYAVELLGEIANQAERAYEQARNDLYDAEHAS